MINCVDDWDLALTLCEKYPQRFLYVPQRLYTNHRRFGADSLVSNAGYAQWAQSFEKIYQKHKDDEILYGQMWYPHKVEKYTRLEREYRNGKGLPCDLYYFKNTKQSK